MADDCEITDEQLADWIGPYSPRPEAGAPPPNTCPQCKTWVDPSNVFDVGGWNGCSATAFASGPIFRIQCPICKADLRSYHNVRDEDGNIPDDPLPLDLVWGLADSDT
ncbi:MAG: hypothetical protein CMJ78_05020 [Planctomycetaceae bacterium]|nr:hypothetical protein [Planctomycetaceae bacterium]